MPINIFKTCSLLKDTKIFLIFNCKEEFRWFFYFETSINKEENILKYIYIYIQRRVL